ncbi:MAG: SAM hydrolase/SAM-dependent halogenase family protein [Pyrinomonadaceae bacterium]
MPNFAPFVNPRKPGEVYDSFIAFAVFRGYFFGIFYMSDNITPRIIALITDFGTADYFVGAMKGVILSINPVAQTIDITHEIPPQNIASASFALRACYRNFPEKTIFVAVVDPGVGSNRKAILVETIDYFFIAPDNGLLSFVFDETESFRVYELSNEQFFRRPISRTFHGRDVFASAAAHLSNGAKPEKFGAIIKNYVHAAENKPQNSGENEIAAEIIHIDRFGNLITNLRKKDAPENFSLKIAGQTIEKMREFYSEAESAEVFMIWGSAGFLEIVAFNDSAAALLNAEIGQKVILRKTALI